MIERTLVIIKPDGIQRSLMGKIITRLEDAGLKIIGMKMRWVDEKFAEKHYFDVKERYGDRILKSLTGYLAKGPVLAMVVEGVQAVSIIRKIVGATYPHEAAPGTIRGDFSHISKDHANKHEIPVSNLIHASAKPEEAKYEIELWFTKEEMHTYKTVHDVHVI
ncbi:nucleoside-diphosphate kinase [Candidatus Woesearchaeota archaeon]|nr:nucleoside-diphosphate kinase [Candidatus Woesearchaeota archaeon]